MLYLNIVGIIVINKHWITNGLHHVFYCQLQLETADRMKHSVANN